MYYSFRVLVLTAGLSVATAAHAETTLLDSELFLDPRQEETFALIAQDLASLSPAGALRPVEDAGTEREFGDIAAGPAPVTASYAGTSPLDPENFLDPDQDETFALIAQNLAALAAVAETPVEAALEAAAAPVEEPVVAAMTAEPAPAAELEAHAADRTIRNNEMETLAAVKIDLAPAAVETTGSISSDADSLVDTSPAAESMSALIDELTP